MGKKKSSMSLLLNYAEVKPGTSHEAEKLKAKLLKLMVDASSGSNQRGEGQKIWPPLRNFL